MAKPGSPAMTPAARPIAGAIALFAGAVLLLRVWLSVGETGSLGAALLAMSQYFTVLTNLAVCLILAAIAAGRRVPVLAQFAIVTGIAGVAVIYHVFLAHLVTLQGLELWVDHGLHSFVPALAVLWWLLFAPKPAFGVAMMLASVVWPLLYGAYILARAHFSGFYPYPFINLDELGWSGLRLNIVYIILGFNAIGSILMVPQIWAED